MRLIMIMCLLFLNCYTRTFVQHLPDTQAGLSTKEIPPPPPPPPPIRDVIDSGFNVGMGRAVTEPVELEMATMPRRHSHPVAAVEPPVESEEDYFKSQLHPGMVSYDIPQDLKVGCKYMVELRIDKKESPALTTGMSEHHEEAYIQVSMTMKAVLSGASFEIDTLNSTIQLRKFDQPTVWKWEIKPKKSGDRTLKIKVSCILKRQGYSDENYDVVVYEVKRKIKMDFLASLIDFWIENWKTLIGFAISTGLIGWIIKKILRKKSADDKK